MDELAGYIKTLAEAGVPLFPDETLEEALRDKAGLPSADDEGRDTDPTRPASSIPTDAVMESFADLLGLEREPGGQIDAALDPDDTGATTADV